MRPGEDFVGVVAERVHLEGATTPWAVTWWRNSGELRGEKPTGVRELVVSTSVLSVVVTGAAQLHIRHAEHHREPRRSDEAHHHSGERALGLEA